MNPAKKILISVATLIYLIFLSVSPSLAQGVACQQLPASGTCPTKFDGSRWTQCGSLCCPDPNSCSAAKLVNPAAAGGSNKWYDPTHAEFEKKVFGGDQNEIFGERYTYAQVNWIINSIYSFFTPHITSVDDMVGLVQSLRQSSSRPALKDYAQLGLPGLLVGGISESLLQPPISGIQEIKSMAAKAFDMGTGVQPAYAQGYGFDQLSVVRTLWTATRNMAYFLSIILLIAAGFAIMFRIKINPQTVVSLQTMIPKLVIALLLITFSYAIAGLIIDLIYVLIALFLSGLAFFGVFPKSSLTGAVSWFTGSGFSGVVLYYTIPGLLVFLGSLFGLFGLGSLLLSWSGISMIIGIIVWIIVIWTLFKIWWMLVKTQLTLIFLIAIGPLQIMLDLIPGQSGFGSWIRNIIANASVFVSVPIMLALNMLFWRPIPSTASVFGISFSDLLSRLTSFININPLGNSNPLVNTGAGLPNLPFVNGNGAIFNFVAGYAILTLIPKVADMIRDALKVPAFKYGTAFGEAAAPLTKSLGGGLIGYGKDLATKKGGAPFAGGVIQTVGESLSSFKG